MSLPKSFAHTFQLIASPQRELRAGDATRLPPPRYRSKRRLPSPPHAQQRNHCDRVSVVFDEISVAGLGAMNSADQPTPDECREVAAELRELADQARLPEIKADLLDLAERFERMAALVEASRGFGARHVN